MQCDMRALTPSVTLLTHVAAVDLAVEAWPEAFGMQEKPSGVYKMPKNAWRPGLRPFPALGSLQRAPSFLF